MRKPPVSEECPHCGAVIAAGRLACPECGSDASTGWKSAEEIDYQAVELPDDESDPRARSRGMLWLMVLLVIAFVIAVVSWR